ncbi:MAG: gamma-glutamyl-gamma-aminobutyrate hydrolase family protein [Planctomycetota bacterium]
MHPVIGLNADRKGAPSACRVELNSAYPDAIVRAGGLPLILPAEAVDDLAEMLAHVDAVVLVGGDDYHSELYGEPPHPTLAPMPIERQRFDLELARLVLERGIPALGICGGSQLLNLVRGGSLIQDLPAEVGTSVEHRSDRGWDTWHEVRVARGSALEKITGATLTVNSWHHQAVKQLGHGVEAVAWAADGVIEGITIADQAFCLGVQWHPEELRHDPGHRDLFQALVTAARMLKVAR